jgi:hypothetical protein
MRKQFDTMLYRDINILDSLTICVPIIFVTIHKILNYKSNTCFSKKNFPESIPCSNKV